MKIFFVSVYSCHFFLISSASVRSIPFCPLLSPSLHEMFPWFLQFSWRDLVFLILLFSLFLWIVHLRRPSYLSLVFSPWISAFSWVYLSLSWGRKWQYRPWGHKESDMTERVHFHFFLSLLFFSQLFVKPLRQPPETTISFEMQEGKFYP